jgi:hypothetical protein
VLSCEAGESLTDAELLLLKQRLGLTERQWQYDYAPRQGVLLSVATMDVLCGKGDLAGKMGRNAR